MTVTLILHQSQSAYDITGVEPAATSSGGTTRVVLSMRCRQCPAPATTAIRSGLEWHPTCVECATWWSPARRGPLANVEPDYYFERDDG